MAADARLYEAEKAAEAVRISADAHAYSVRVEAEAEAEQTRVVALAILQNGQPAIDFEIMKRQVEALGQIASSSNAKTIIVPSEITRAIGSLQVVLEGIRGGA